MEFGIGTIVAIIIFAVAFWDTLKISSLFVKAEVKHQADKRVIDHDLELAELSEEYSEEAFKNADSVRNKIKQRRKELLK